MLKPSGLFAFCMSSPIRDVCFDPVAGAVTGSSRPTTSRFWCSTMANLLSINFRNPQ